MAEKNNIQIKKESLKQTSKSNNPDDNTLKVLTHVLGLLAGFWGSLIILLLTTDESVKKHAKINLNWIFSMMIYLLGFFILFIVSIPLMFVLVGFFTIFLAILGFIAIGVLHVVFSIMAAVKASNDLFWKYPLSIPFFKVEI